MPLFDDTVKSRIQKMSIDFEEQVIDKIKRSPTDHNIVNYLYLLDYWMTLKRLKRSYYFLKNLKRRRKVQILWM